MAYLTDSELIKKYEYYALQLEQRLLEEEDYITVLDDIPAMAIVSRSDDIDILYTTKKHQEKTGYSAQQIREECPDFLKKAIHPASLEFVKGYLPTFYQKENNYRTTAFIQYAQLKGCPDFTPLITFTKPSRAPNGLVLRMIMQPHEMQALQPKMEQIVKLDLFRLKHFKMFQNLTEREIEILKLLANGMNNKHISDALFLSRQTVETHRKNLKRKLGLTSFLDLMRYAFAFDLVEC